jgi:hypothetical protein
VERATAREWVRRESKHQEIKTPRCATVEHATTEEWVGRAVRGGRGRHSREPGRSAETVLSSDGESGSGEGLEGRAVVQIPSTVPARAVLLAPVSGSARRTSGRDEGVKILDLRCALLDTIIRPGSASPFEDVAGKIFDILDSRERTGHNIRLGVSYTWTVSATLPFQIFYTMLFWSFCFSSNLLCCLVAIVIVNSK